MDYPKIDVENVVAEGQEVVSFFNVIKQCIWQIIDGETVHERADMNDKELDEFIGSLTNKHFVQFRKFFDTMPKLKHTIKVKNPKTKKTSEMTLQGLNDFFG